MSWTVPQSPLAVPRDPWVSVVDDAIVTPSQRGRVHVESAPTAPRGWMTGAVHDAAGDLVTASIRTWSGDRLAPVAVDPAQVRIPANADRLEGSWRYAGNWTMHFGHFFLEVLPTLWGDPGDPGEGRGLLFHQSPRVAPPAQRRGPRTPDQKPWQREFLALAGFGDADIRVVLSKPVRADRLVVPSRPVLLKAWAAPEAVDVWRRISDAVGERGDARRVFLSRTLFHETEADRPRSRRSEAEWDAHLDAEFARAGFAVVHPERLPLREQLALVRGADVLAGASGSALHLSAFARSGTRVLEVGDSRSPATPMPTQLMIDAACGHLSEFVPHLGARELRRALTSLD